MKKRLLASALAALMVLSMTACDSSNGGTDEITTITFSIWDENQYPVYEEIIAVFEDENPDINVEMQLTPWDQYWTKLDASLNGGSAADVFWMNTYLQKYASAGVIEPLTDYIADSDIDLSEYAPACVELSSSVDGVLYGMPKGMDIVPVFLNTAIFEKYDVELPSTDWDWDELIETCEELQAAIDAAGGTEYPIVLELTGQSSYSNFIYQDGVPNWDGQTPSYGLEGANQAFDDILYLWDSGLMPSYAILSDTTGTELFAAGKAAITYSGTWLISQYDALSFASDLVLYEQPTRADNNSSVLSGLSFAMNSASENKDAAWRLIEFLGGETSNKMQAEAGIDIPALISAQEYYSTENLDVSIIPEMAAEAFFSGYNDISALTYTLVSDYTARIYSRDLTVEEGLARLSEEIMELW